MLSAKKALDKTTPIAHRNCRDASNATATQVNFVDQVHFPVMAEGGHRKSLNQENLGR